MTPKFGGTRKRAELLNFWGFPETRKFEKILTKSHSKTMQTRDKPALLEPWVFPGIVIHAGSRRSFWGGAVVSEGPTCPIDG